MPPICVMLKPASGSCDLRCQYCFYHDITENRLCPNYGMMSEATLEAVIQKTLAYAEGSCSFIYQGGEPTLAGLEFYRKSLALQKKYAPVGLRVENSIQTNGYRIDKEWAKFFADNQFLVGISLDGTRKTHDAYRRSPSGEGTFFRIMETIDLLNRYQVEYNILTVVHRQTAARIKEIYTFYKKHQFRYLQFIPCLDPIGETGGQYEYSLTPEQYGTFLKDLFKLWYEDLQKGQQPYIRQFENYIGIFLGYMPAACEQRGICGKQYVVEADGEVYPCDFYMLDEYQLGNLNEVDYPQIDKTRRELQFVERSMPVSKQCRDCRFYKLCRCGCNRMRIPHPNGGSINYFCEAYQAFFSEYEDTLRQIADTIAAHQQNRT